MLRAWSRDGQVEIAPPVKTLDPPVPILQSLEVTANRFCMLFSCLGTGSNQLTGNGTSIRTGIFAGMAAGLLIMLWLASGFWLSGVVTERMVIFIVMLLLVELASLAVPGKEHERAQIPFQLLYASVGKHL